MTDSRASVEIPETDDTRFSWRKLWAFMGPGWIMSMAYLDPGNLESDLQAGAVGGYQLIWVLLWTTLLGLIMQTMSAKLGVVTGKHLAELCRQEMSRPVYIALWIMTELAIIGSDIQEVIGSAIALNILTDIPLWGGVLLTTMDTFVFLLLHRQGVRKLEALFASLILVMAICFFINFIISKPDGTEIVKGMIIPRIPKYALFQSVGMLGAIIMPHNIYLHSAIVLSRKVDRNNPDKIREANMYNAVESTISLATCFFINVCVISVFAKGFWHPGEPNFEIGLKEAGNALAVAFGERAKVIWAIGLLAAGQSSTMSGTLAGQFVMEGFIGIRVPTCVRVMLTRSVAIIPAMIVSIISAQNFDLLDEWLNVLQSIQLPFALFPLIFFVTGPLCGEFRPGYLIKGIMWAGTILVVFVNFVLVLSFANEHLGDDICIQVFLVILGVTYTSFLVYLTWNYLPKCDNSEVLFDQLDLANTISQSSTDSNRIYGMSSPSISPDSVGRSLSPIPLIPLPL
jgi:natural resistance-associated macrophage protein